MFENYIQQIIAIPRAGDCLAFSVRAFFLPANWKYWTSTYDAPCHHLLQALPSLQTRCMPHTADYGMLSSQGGQLLHCACYFHNHWHKVGAGPRQRVHTQYPSTSCPKKTSKKKPLLPCTHHSDPCATQDCSSPKPPPPNCRSCSPARQCMGTCFLCSKLQRSGGRQGSPAASG
jgi:hypothetical protein